MSYISRYDVSFTRYMSRKYEEYQVEFEFIDDYLLWLYEECCHGNERFYYQTLEEDIISYSNFQTGKERDKKE